MRNVVGEYDSAMVVCASEDEVEDLEEEDININNDDIKEEEDVAKIVALVTQCRGDMQKECMPFSQWNTAQEVVAKTKWVENAQSSFQERLNVIMADYMDEGDEEEEVGGGGGDDADMD